MLVIAYNRTRVPARAMSRAVKAIGIYPQAVVVRGHDWKWANQDGKYCLMCVCGEGVERESL